MSKGDESLIVAEGVWGTVEYAIRTNGKALAREFIDAPERI